MHNFVSSKAEDME